MICHAPIPRELLGCLVAGYEKGGTTLVKDLLRDTGRMTSRFEGGLLLAESPLEGIPEPYATSLLRSWELPDDFLNRYRDCESFTDGYRLLKELSSIREKHLPLLDKTPRYMAFLPDVLRRAPGTPIIVVLRDPLLVTSSWLRQGKTVADAAAAIAFCTAGLAAVPQERRAAVYVVRFDDVAIDPGATSAAIHAWLGRAADPYDADRPIGTAPPGELPSPGIDPSRLELARYWSEGEIARITEELAALIPWAPLVATVPSGPLVDVHQHGAPLWDAILSASPNLACLGNSDPVDMKVYCPLGKETFDDEMTEEAPSRGDRCQAT